jgi:hypothetical protein
MATTKKKSPPKKSAAASPTSQSRRPSSSEYRRSSDYRRSYVRLRTLLDALEIAAVCFYMDGDTAAEKNYRAEEIERQIRPLLMELNRNFAQGCPPGFFNCGGCCVPYRCPSDT